MGVTPSSKERGEDCMGDNYDDKELQSMMEVLENPGEFRPGCIVEITTKEAERIVVRRYYVSDDYAWLDEEIAEFPAYHKRNKKNIINFLRGTKKQIEDDYGKKEPLYIDQGALDYLKKVM